MNPTVITTGPGVTIATATASRNSWSFSQPYSFTTPLYRNGTMASPLPNTNAPALVKNSRICPSVFKSASGTLGQAIPSGSTAAAIGPVPPQNTFGGVFTSQTSTPAPRNSHTDSDSVMVVTAALTT